MKTGLNWKQLGHSAYLRLYRVIRQSPEHKRQLEASRIERKNKQARARYAREASSPRPGEVQMKVWVMEQAEACGVKPGAIWMRIYRGKLKPQIRKVNIRLGYVQTN